MIPSMTIWSFAAMAPAWPAMFALLIGALAFVQRRPREQVVVALTHIALWLTLASMGAGTLLWLRGGLQPVDLRLFDIYRSGDYALELRLYFDLASVVVATVASVLILATSRFAQRYLHREPGFLRFFVLMLIFASGVMLLVLGGSYDLLLAGWEIVGWTSVLLVGFFQERQGPVRAALRVLVTYRLCDIGLLVGAVALHGWLHSTAYQDIFEHVLGSPGGGTALFVGLCLLFAAMGKSAQIPVGGWLPRAMEGPTASSAVFYGGLSVHMGVYLLIRSAPVLEHAPLVRLGIVVIGGVTAVMAALSGQVSADAKSGLAYATISQVGLMFVEVGLGLPKLALLHLAAHSLLRYYQFLRTPSTLQDALMRRRAGGVESVVGQAQASLPRQRFLYRLAIERFAVEAVLDRWVARPLLSLARALGRREDALVAWLMGQSRDGKDQGHAN
jgi:NADH:ubiquinone oxidoreductase subunit 5 (subunit L)/multisubunit Na+/H+ antiporter MnhA subunit